MSAPETKDPAPGTLPLQFPKTYALFVSASLLDVLVTGMLLRVGDEEAGSLVAWIVVHAGLVGLFAVKGAVVIAGLVLCEFLARRHQGLGRALIWLGVGVQLLSVIEGGWRYLVIMWPAGGMGW